MVKITLGGGEGEGGGSGGGADGGGGGGDGAARPRHRMMGRTVGMLRDLKPKKQLCGAPPACAAPKPGGEAQGQAGDGVVTIAMARRTTPQRPR